EYRFNWNTPIVVSSHDSDVVYIGANHLLRSRDRGQSWQEASPDLTKAIDRDTLPIMGMEVTDSTLSEHDGIRFYGTITAIAESPASAEVLYVGTDDGNLQVSRDGGVTWRNVIDRVPDAPPRTYVSRIEASRHAPGRVYVTLDGHRNDDYAAYVFVSEDHGESWRRITEGLPETSVNVIREHPRTPSLLFVGNEVGLFVSVDRGESWARLEANLPTVPVDDLAIHERANDLVIGTHGRSIWILDDVAPLEQATTEVLASASHLFRVRPAAQHSLAGGWPFHGDAFMAENPPEGAVIRYWLREKVEPEPAVASGVKAGAEAGERASPGGDGVATGPLDGAASGGSNGQEAGDDEDDAPPVRLEILDAGGTVVRTLDAVNEPGVHEIVWDFRIDPAYESEGGGGFGGGGRGPRVLPGTYTARLVAGERSHETAVPVEPDPRLPIAETDREARQRALMEVHTLRKPFRDAEDRIDEMSDRLEEIEEMLADAELPADTKTPLEEEAEAIAEQLEELEEELDDVGVGFLSFAIEGSTSLPTEDQMWQLERAWEEGPPLIERVNAILTERLPALEERLEAQGMGRAVGDAVEVPPRP
ncbi:MAG: VPS10 domain-containing protein, partial [Gemmatimonadota bacterium]